MRTSSWRRLRSTLFALFAAGHIVAVEPTPEESRLKVANYSGPYFAGTLQNHALDEASGLTASRRTSDLLWSHNDSDAGPTLFALGADGRHRGSVNVLGAQNVDWEGIRSFTHDGQAWLLIGDVGFKDGKRTSFTIYVLPEPDPAWLSPQHAIDVPLHYSFSFAYADHAARDCESIAVDVGEQAIYLLEKRTYPNALYRLPLHPDGPKDPTPTLVAEIHSLPQPSAELRETRSVKASWRANPTDMDFAADGSAAVIVTYCNAYLYPRAPGQSWAEALNQPPQRLPTFHLDRAEPEAICFASDNRTLFLTGEKPPAPVLRYEPLNMPLSAAAGPP